MKKIYIAGPMSGLPELNFPAFFSAEEFLLNSLQGYQVVNPARLDEESKAVGESVQDWAFYLKRDLPHLVGCDAVALLPGWTSSKGACLEALVGTLLGLRVEELGYDPVAKWYFHMTGSDLEILRAAMEGINKHVWAEEPETLKLVQPEKMSVCVEAERLVNGERQADYGHPLFDFTRTGRMWGAILGLPDIPPQFVAMMMTALKISRECNKPKRDNIVDGIGYLATIEKIEQKVAELQKGAA